MRQSAGRDVRISPQATESRGQARQDFDCESMRQRIRKHLNRKMANDYRERGTNMKNKNIFLASCLAAAIIAVPARLRADTNNAIPDPVNVQDIANHLSTKIR